MRRVFVDTSGFVAHLIAEDQFHARAVELFAAASAGWELITTNAVVFESYTVLRTQVRHGRDLALRFLDVIAAGLCTHVRVEPEDEAHAIGILRSHHDKVYSFCDALSFAVMERLGLQEVITFDRDFLSYGRFTVL